MRISLVTDSNAQLSAELRLRFGVTVVPFTVVVDGVPYLEGVDLDPAWFYDELAAGASVSTAAPAPGPYLRAYEEAAARGADGIVSVHVGSNVSSALSSARLAAGMSPVPVEVVDTGTASFAVACCVWEAHDALRRGASASDAAEAARAAAGRVGNVFVAGSLQVAARGGRLAPGVNDLPVLGLVDGLMRPVAAARSADDAVDAMVEHVRRAGDGLHVGVGHACAPDAAARLLGRLGDLANADEIVQYHVGPTVGAHTGPGTFGAVFYPRTEPRRDPRAPTDAATSSSTPPHA